MIPYGKQSISDADVDAVARILRSDYLTQGPEVPAFESMMAAYSKARYGVAMNSATSALHVACLALDLQPGDRVWTTPISFVASANCALYCGAQIDFVDIRPDVYNMDVSCLRRKLDEADRTGTLPKIIIPVHLCGQPCDMAEIHDLSRRYGFKIIEDASHAVGATYLGKPVGSCGFSDITIFSFHPVKIITTAEGGMAMTNNETLARKMQRLRSHGITREASEMTHSPDGPWYYQQIELGFNYRITDLQAALGRTQLQCLDRFLARRWALSLGYSEMLKGLPVLRPTVISDRTSSWHLYVIRLELGEIKRTHREVFECLRGAGIGVNLHYIPIYLQPYYRRMGFAPGYCPAAEQYYAEAISLPMYADLSDGDQQKVVAALKSLVE